MKPNRGLKFLLLSKKDFNRSEKYWIDLEKKSSNVPLICSWNWVKTWITHFGDVIDYWFCVGFSRGKVVGISLITKEAKGKFLIPVNTYHLGTQGESMKDWIHMVNNNILVLDSYRQGYTDLLAEVIMKKFSWEEFVINDADLTFGTRIKNALATHSDKVRQVDEVCHIVNLDSLRLDGKSIMENLKPDTRYIIKRNLREFGEIITEWATTPTQASSIFGELIKLHSAAFAKKGKRGAFKSPRFSKFHKALINKQVRDGKIILFRAKSKRLGTIGCFYLFNDNGVAFGYQAGLRDFSRIKIKTINNKRIKPGFVMHALCMQACLDRGFSEYNFSVGDAGYKNELTTETRLLTTIKVQNSIRAKLRDTLFETYLKMDEKKQFQFLLKPLYSIYSALTKE